MSARIAALAFALLAVGAAHGRDASPDTSEWVCKFCTFEDGSTGWLEPTLGWVSDRSFHFGNFTGLEEDGAFLDLGGGWRYRNAEAGTAWDVRAEHLGLDSRAIEARGGKQGRYRVAASYESLERLRAGDARTPFEGRASLSLPAGWTEGGSTSGMSDLDASLRGVELRQQRERAALGLEFTPRPHVDLRFDYHRDEISGTGAIGGSFLTLASELPRPLDQTLDRIDASAAYRHASGHHALLSLGASVFNNGVGALGWDNPYSGPTPEARTGQMAQAPDNRAQQLSLALGTAPDWRLQMAGTLALGRIEQDQRFLPATVNPDEAAALPRTSLDGRVDTTRVNARASLPVGGSFRLTADVLRDDRDTLTPVAPYTQVVMDTFTGQVRSNAPYGYTRNRWRFSAEHRARPRIALGVDDDRRERRLYGTASTIERKYWGRVSWRPFEGADLRLKAATAERRGEEYAGPAGVPAQNTLMRAFNTADRDRDEVRADFSLSRANNVTAFNVTWSDDDYPDTTVGRTSGRDLGYGADMMLQSRENLSVSAFASHRKQESGQSGSENFGPPDWAAQLEDTTDVFGVHAEWQGPRGLELGADYTLARSEGAISMLTVSGESGFPVLLTRWHDARIYARYPLRPKLGLRVELLREIYDAGDWSLVGPDWVPNLLSLGQGNQSGSVTAVMAGVRWQF
jgi:MtrB/PioB family decaheme-associated outer membrane protein